MRERTLYQLILHNSTDVKYIEQLPFDPTSLHYSYVPRICTSCNNHPRMFQNKDVSMFSQNFLSDFFFATAASSFDCDLLKSLYICYIANFD